jgi:hypothetical protein
MMKNERVNSAEPRLVQGSHLILAVLCLSLLAALGGWAYHRQLQRRTIALWGPETAELLLHAPRVELWQLESAESANGEAEVIEVSGVRRRVGERSDATHLPGMTHLRHGLMNDGAFDWSRADERCQPTWTHALRFDDGDRRATLVFDFECGLVACVETGAEASIRPIAAGTRQMLAGAAERMKDEG